MPTAPARTATTARRTGRRSSRPEWRELYQHALREADRLGLEMSLNIQSGWNLGGPMVTADDAAKKLVWSETARRPARRSSTQKLPEPASRDGYYRDAVRAWPTGCKQRRSRAAPVAGVNAEFRAAGPSGRARSPTATRTRSGFPAAAKPARGPSRQRPEWLQFEFLAPVDASTGSARAAARLRPARVRAAGLRRRQDLPRRQGVHRGREDGDAS